MTCDNLLTVVNGMYLDSVVPGTMRLFRPQEQYTYLERVVVETVDTECTPGCGLALGTSEFVAGDFTGGFPEVYDLKMVLRVLDLCTGEVHIPTEGTVKTEVGEFSVEETIFRLITGLNIITVEVIFEGISLKLQATVTRDVNNVTDARWISPLNFSADGLLYPMISVGDIPDFIPYTGAAPLPTVVSSKFNEIYLIGRSEYTYTSNGNFTQRYEYTWNGIKIFSEIYQPITGCPTLPKNPCCTEKVFYKVTCDGNDYLLPEGGIVISSVVIDPEDRDFRKKRETVILQDDSVLLGEKKDYSEFTWQPDIRKIWRQANIIRM